MPTSLLLAEDDPRLRQDLERHFLNRGFQVLACANGSQALSAIRQSRFDLVLLDIMLPGIDGLSLLDELRHQQAVPVMLMSALGAEQDRISGFTGARTITCPSRSAWPNSTPGSMPCYGAWRSTAGRRCGPMGGQ